MDSDKDNLGNSNTQSVVTSTPPNSSEKDSSKRVLLAVLGIVLLIVGVASGVFLVGNNQLRIGKAWDCRLYVFNVTRDGLVTVRNDSSRNEPPQQAEVFINGNKTDTFNVPKLDKGDTANLGNVDVDSREGFSWRVRGTLDCDNSGSYSGVTPTPTEAPAACPPNTELLFSKSGNLNTGDGVAVGGTVSSSEGSWKVGSRNGVLMAEDGSKLSVNFPNLVYLDTALIYDNDPKSGESPWSINGKSLPVTDNNKWAPPFKLDISSTQMNFDYGGDSPHFNVCVKEQSIPTNTPTPIPSNTNTPTPTFSPSPTPTLPPTTAQCLNVNAYDTDWNLLSADDLQYLSEGDVIKLAVKGQTSGGSFDKARFSINEQQIGETDDLTPATQEYYIEYTIPANVKNFSVKGEVHHSELGWI
jgi:hypothetical protein